MWVGTQVGKWKRRDGFGKIDLYTRGSLHSLIWAMILCEGMLSVTRPVRHSDAPATLIGATVLAAVAQGVCAAPLVSRALDAYLGRRPIDRRLLVPAAALMVLNTTGLLALGGYAGTGGFPELQLALGASVLPFLTSFVLVVPVWLSGVCFAALAGAVSGGTLLAGASGTFALGTFLGVGFGSTLIATTSRLSAWTLGVMLKLREAQDVETRLAVAEERLRFGRDMHDVLGRNLAVIALKSELAVELAQRGKAAAVDQMTEVQRIARASQQEVRDVVRGYREVDLRTEIAGAQGVLEAAGIGCAVEDGDPHPGEHLPAPVRSALGWVVREAATNVLRHGDPRRCSIRLRADGDTVRLVVENDGVPPDTAVPPGHGSGLAGLRERLGALDGLLEAGPTGDGGFRLTATVPLPSPRRDAASLVEERR
ncbi:histidine kinase [Streptomyces sp. BpilaLS-43]|uniref:sensor histidine kinase n=1 Tax=unclassified Streptomyces TaxID=2593676 RepID=UPI00081B9EB5|nr:histidine kinase [Streptomyces sp. BpilaLS-43]MYX75825.1 sensor histidine kinase [Streptomyces sp. SID3915]SCD78221.1 two-component system, NarL family, sensor histidine kinase DesK [Streptomyces sp. BpilaLS-43]